MVWNPLKTLPRNNPCPCQSKKKFKNCCLKTLPDVVPEADAKRYREQMAKPGLVFLTPANKDAIYEAAKMARTKAGQGTA